MNKHLLDSQILDAEQRRCQLLAYEIHDGLCQHLAAAASYLDMTGDSLADDPMHARQYLQRASVAVRDGLCEARRLVSGLRHSPPAELGLPAAIQQLIHQMSLRDGLCVAFEHNLHGAAIPSEVEDVAFRIIQEGLTNVAHHSQSADARVELFRQGGTLWVRIEDSGLGFDPAAVAADRFGLEGMHARAALCGGSLMIQTAPGQGTRIVAELPLRENRD